MTLDKYGDNILTPAELEIETSAKIDENRFDEILIATPPKLKQIAHYAAVWGISDDGYRAEFLRSTREYARQNLRSVVEKFDAELDSWLASDESDGPDFSEAYIAFSSLRMAADES